MREQRIAEAFVELADTLIEDFDIAEFLGRLLHHSTELVGASAAGVMLVDRAGRLQVAAATSEHARLLELFQLQSEQGPCLECFASGEIVTATDLSTTRERWPRFSEAAMTLGYSSVHAVPLRMRTDVIGAFNLFGSPSDSIDDAKVRLAQALAHVATIGILQERTTRQAHELTDQLQRALDSRVIIEQAKGKLAAWWGVDVDTAFTALRSYARNNRMRLTPLAHHVVDGTVDAALILKETRPG